MEHIKTVWRGQIHKIKVFVGAAFGILLGLLIILHPTAPQNPVCQGCSHLLLASVNSGTVSGHKVSDVADSGRLTKKIVPVIQKSFDRYPPYYVFIFIGGFILFALIRLIDPSYLNSVFGAALNVNQVLNLFKEGIFGFNVTSLLLDVVCVFMMGIYVQVFFYASSPQLFLWILGFTSIAYILKLILIQFLANVFMGRLEALMHLLMHLLFTRILGLVLLPLLFVSLYQPVLDVHALLRFVLVAILVLYMVWLVRLFAKMKSIAAVNIIYLFLYLCTVELSTLAILLRNYIRLG